MVPVRERDDGRLVVDVIETRVRIVRVVHNERTTETVTVLCRQVAVVPESTSLVRRGEVIQERVALRDGALVHHSRTIGPVGPLLEQTMPVLESQASITVQNDAVYVNLQL